MKRIISLVLCIAMLALVLVSCGEDAHVHTYNRDEWKSDASNHWYAAACDCEDAGVMKKAAHVDSMNDGRCDICNYLLCNNGANDTEPTYKTEWSSNDDFHWHDATCGHVGHVLKKAFAAHVYTTGSACDTCGRACPNDKYETDFTVNAEYHWYAPVCGHEGHLPVNKVAHTFDEAGVCSECGYECEKTAYSEEWSFDDENHWHDAACGHTHLEPKDLAPHVDADENGECDTCFKALVPVEPEPVE